MADKKKLPVYTVRGKMYWAKLNKDNQRDDKYSFDLQLNTPQTIEFLKGLGLKIREQDKPDRKPDGKFVSMWTYAKGYQSDEYRTFPVYDAKLRVFDGLIGNGSDVNVEFVVKPWEYKGRKGLRAEPRAIQIENLVAFDPKRSAGSLFAPVETDDVFDEVIG